MVERNQQLDRIFGALADPTRRALLKRLAAGEHRVSELAQPFDMSLAAVSKHIRVLEKAGLIKRRVAGRTHHCRLDPVALANAHQWLEFYQQFWDSRLDSLARFLDANPQPNEEKSNE